MMSLPNPSIPVAEQATNHAGEYSLMQQHQQSRLLFSENVKDLKNLSKQLYSASEYFEISYRTKEEEKKVVIESLKEYAIQALVNSIDHLGSIAFKLNNLLDQNLIQLDQMPKLELRLSCVEQRVKTCQQFINLGGLSQQSLAMDQAHNHHKHYYNNNIISSCLTPSRQYQGSSFLYTNTISVSSINSKPENRGLQLRSGSLILQRSISPRRPYPAAQGRAQVQPHHPQPQRTVSLPSLGDREKRREQYSSSSTKTGNNTKGRLFKGMLSLRTRRNKEHDDDTHTVVLY